jgi:hypothetical protein
MIGDVTAYTQNGEVLQKWERVVLQETVSSSFSGNYVNNNAFKTFGINFYDKKSGKHIIIGNAVPYIIEYTVEKNDYEPNVDHVTNNSSNNSDQVSLEQEKNKLINQWKSLQVKEQTLVDMMKGKDKKSIEYQNIKNQHSGIVTQMHYVSNKLKDLFNYDILAQGF